MKVRFLGLFSCAIQIHVFTEVELRELLMKVIQIQLENEQSSSNKVSASNADHGHIILNSLKATSRIREAVIGEGEPAIPIDCITRARELYVSTQDLTTGAYQFIYPAPHANCE